MEQGSSQAAWPVSVARDVEGWIDRLQMAAVVFLGKLPLVKMSLIDVGEEFLSHITPSPVLFEYNERDCGKMQKDI